MKKIFYITTILTISLCSCSNKQSIQSNNWELKVCHRPDPSSHQENDGRRSITIPQMRLQICKMDFMTHGRMEADHWYNKSINTGTEAYNYDMPNLVVLHVTHGTK